MSTYTDSQVREALIAAVELRGRDFVYPINLDAVVVAENACFYGNPDDYPRPGQEDQPACIVGQTLLNLGFDKDHTDVWETLIELNPPIGSFDTGDAFTVLSLAALKKAQQLQDYTLTDGYVDDDGREHGSWERAHNWGEALDAALKILGEE
jgi:hypothetical protein